MTIGQRSVSSTAWNVSANLIRAAVAFVRSILLARLLPVDVFGIYALAGSIVSISVVLPNFGMGGAFLHRSAETEDEEQAAAVHFTLKLLFTSLWALALATGALVFATGQLRLALLVFAMATFGLQLTQTPNLILVRRVIHRRIAVVQLVTTVLSTVVAVALAWMGVTLWALLATDIAALCVQIVLFYIWRPVWRPRLAWDASVVRYYLRFGSRTFLAGVLLQAINHIDDLWTGQVLGKTALGFYSRAYTFATYPRQVLAQPINAVAGGTYAELKGNRKSLSQAFFRTNAFLIRTGFFLAGILALLAPELIQLLLGAKWLPMLDAFRLMLVFTLLDPIKTTVADLFTAVGRPELVVRARSIQLMVLLGGLLLLGRPYGIAGVALAVDGMLIVGLAILFWQARSFVDLSLSQLFGVPSLALACGLGLGFGAVTMLPIGTWDLWAGLTKALAFAGGYGLVSWAFERKKMVRGFRLLVDYVGASKRFLPDRFRREQHQIDDRG